MANFTSLNGISCDNVTSVNGVTKSSVNNVNTLETCSGHNPGPSMSRLYTGFNESGVSFAPVANLGDSVSALRTIFETNSYDIKGGSNVTIHKIAYGKDGSGNPLIILLTSADTKSLYRVTPAQVAAKTTATEISFNGDSQIKQNNVAYGNGVWISVGNLGETVKNIFRSTDGTTWDPVAITSLPSMPTGAGKKIYALTTDGAGKWWFGIDANPTVVGSTSYIYCSTDDGQNWSLHHTLTTSDIYRLTYTNDTLVATYNYAPGDGSGGRSAISAAGSATSGASNWGTPVFLAEGGLRTNDMIAKSHGPDTVDDGLAKRIASGGGRVVACDTHNAILLIVNGKTITVSGARTAIASSYVETKITGVATDGEGNWYIAGGTSGNEASIAKNTNNADPSSWAILTNNISPSSGTGVGNDQAFSIAVDRYLPV